MSDGRVEQMVERLGLSLWLVLSVESECVAGLDWADLWKLVWQR